MEIPHQMESLSEVMNSQRKKGFSADFRYENEKFIAGDKKYNPEDLTVVQVFRFEGISDPAYMEVLYCIETTDGTKGLFIDAFGAYGAQDAQKYAASIKKMKILDNHSKN